MLDTNVLVSGLLSPFGPPGEILRMVSSGAIVLCFDARILAEYDAVLLRDKFGFDYEAVVVLLDWIDTRGEVVAAAPLTCRLPDPDDEPFLEVALASGAECLVTGDLAHFPPHARGGAVVLSPAELIERVRHAGPDA